MESQLGFYSQRNNPFMQDDDEVSRLPGVSDPEQTFAEITRGEFNDYVRDFEQFELDAIERAQNDTSLIDAAREDSTQAGQIAGQVAQRNLSRYGGQLTPAQQQQQSASLQRSTALGSIQALSDARIAQREANQALLADLIDIGQGVNRASQRQLGSAAADANARSQAYRNAKAQSQAQTYQTVGSLASAAILAAFV
tara:strand:+ start:6206 stop:6796 length:591 start_codon:yes stop_codon:yes gene_type:complete